MESSVFYENSSIAISVDGSEYNPSKLLVADTAFVRNRIGLDATVAELSLERNLFWKNSTDWTAGNLPDDHVFADPRFIDPSTRDFALSEGSAALGAGRRGQDIGLYPHRTP